MLTLWSLVRLFFSSALEMLGCYDSRPRIDAPRTLKVQIPRIARAQETPERCVRTCNKHGICSDWHILFL